MSDESYVPEGPTMFRIVARWNAALRWRREFGSWLN